MEQEARLVQMHDETTSRNRDDRGREDHENGAEEKLTEKVKLEFETAISEWTQSAG